MIPQSNMIPGYSVVLDEVMDILRHYRSIVRWSCGVCGMIHSHSMPDTCDSCGSDLLEPYIEQHMEIGDRW